MAHTDYRALSSRDVQGLVSQRGTRREARGGRGGLQAQAIICLKYFINMNNTASSSHRIFLAQLGRLRVKTGGPCCELDLTSTLLVLCWYSDDNISYRPTRFGTSLVEATHGIQPDSRDGLISRWTRDEAGDANLI